MVVIPLCFNKCRLCQQQKLDAIPLEITVEDAFPPALAHVCNKSALLLTCVMSVGVITFYSLHALINSASLM